MMSFDTTATFRIGEPGISLPQVPLPEVADSLFGDSRFRPTPFVMQSLISRGLAENTIVAAGITKGLQKPTMDVTLEDLDVALPHFQHISDELAASHSDDTLIFAARDGEAVFDDFAIRYPDICSRLLPASSSLWYSSGMKNKELASDFLARHGVSEADVRDDKKFVLVDSGFFGTIAQRLDNSVENLHGCSLLSLGRLSVKLVCADIDGIGQQIISLPNRGEWPKHDKMRGKDDFPSWTTGNTFGLAVGMQLMPRYQGSFVTLEKNANEVVAIPDYEQVNNNVDDVGGSVNSSVVNPVAAAIVQFRIVKAAMERSEPNCGSPISGSRFGPF